MANVTFTEAASTDIHHRADITFAYFTQRADGSAAAGSGPNAINAYAYYPPSSKPGSDNAFAGTVWFNKNFATHQAPVSGDFSSQTFTHELGHATGLAHRDLMTPRWATRAIRTMPLTIRIRCNTRS